MTGPYAPKCSGQVNVISPISSLCRPPPPYQWPTIEWKEAPLESFSRFERFQIQAIGIKKGMPFSPDAAFVFAQDHVDSGFDWRTSTR